jgi:WD40 repeat protein
MFPLAMRHHTRSGNFLRVAPDGECLAAASSDSTLSAWDPGDGRCLHVLEGHRADVESCDFSPDSRHLASVSSDGNVRVRDAVDGRCMASLQVDGQLSGCAWTGKTGELVAVGAMGVYFLACRGFNGWA